MLGVGMGEVGITDRNLLALRRQHPDLLVHKHSAREEVRTGADWEWWIGTASGWTCLVFQAKRLGDDGRYHGLTKVQPSGLRQVDALIRACWDRSNRLQGVVWPLYCLYNSWPGAWPDGVPNLLYSQTSLQPVSVADLSLYGCAVVEAQVVRQVVTGRQYSHRRTVRDTY